MARLKHNLDYEEKLISLLGYKMEKSKINNHWNIFDKDGEIVGFIICELLEKTINQGKILISYRYKTLIDSTDISFENDRTSDYTFVNRAATIINKEKDFYYKLSIKRNEEKRDNLSFTLGDKNTIYLESEKNGIYSFDIPEDGELRLSFYSKIPWQKEDGTQGFYNAEDFLVFNYKKGSCLYQKSICDDNIAIDYNGSHPNTTFEISAGKSDLPQNPSDDYLIRRAQIEQPDIPEERRLIIREKTWENRLKKGEIYPKLLFPNACVVDGTVEEFILNSDFIMDSIKQFIYLLNPLLPFDNNFMKEIFNENFLERREIILFKDAILEALSWCEANDDNMNLDNSSSGNSSRTLKM